jgi:hypothetical protein
MAYGLAPTRSASGGGETIAPLTSRKWKPIAKPVTHGSLLSVNVTKSA